MMSNEIEHAGQPSEQALGLFLQEGDGDKLTDILVEALYEALRIMEEDGASSTFH
jgi:hypothetical protein